jgi:hypothetical protein
VWALGVRASLSVDPDDRADNGARTTVLAANLGRTERSVIVSTPDGDATATLAPGTFVRLHPGPTA